MATETAEVPWISPTELAGGAAAAPLLDPDGGLVDPILVLDCDGREDRDALRAARSCNRILIGVATRPVTGDLAAALDLTLVPRAAVSPAAAETAWPLTPALVGVDDPQAAAAAIVSAVRANPRSAVLLVDLLRTEIRDPLLALRMESLAYSTLLGGPEFARWLAGASRPPAPEPVAEPVRVRRTSGPDGEVLHVTLSRPDRRNAYGRQLRDALVDALAVAEAEPGLSVRLDGAGPIFCAGGDLGEFGTTPDPVTAHLIRVRAGAAAPLIRLRERVQARVHGHCVGAGAELAAFAGEVLAAPGTTFRLPELGMGLIPGAGGTVSLPHRIGRWRTLYATLTGAELDLDTALDWGLVDGVAD